MIYRHVQLNLKSQPDTSLEKGQYTTHGAQGNTLFPSEVVILLNSPKIKMLNNGDTERIKTEQLVKLKQCIGTVNKSNYWTGFISKYYFNKSCICMKRSLIYTMFIEEYTISYNSQSTHLQNKCVKL